MTINTVQGRRDLGEQKEELWKNSVCASIKVYKLLIDLNSGPRNPEPECLSSTGGFFLRPRLPDAAGSLDWVSPPHLARPHAETPGLSVRNWESPTAAKTSRNLVRGMLALPARTLPHSLDWALHPRTAPGSSAGRLGGLMTGEQKERH